MNTTTRSHPLLKVAEQQLNELERKISEEEYDSFSDGFDEEFYELKNSLQEISDILPVEAYNDRIVLKGLIKSIIKISEEQDLYDADGELEMMFPDGED